MRSYSNLTVYSGSTITVNSSSASTNMPNAEFPQHRVYGATGLAAIRSLSQKKRAQSAPPTEKTHLAYPSPNIIALSFRCDPLPKMSGYSFEDDLAFSEDMSEQDSERSISGDERDRA